MTFASPSIRPSTRPSPARPFLKVAEQTVAQRQATLDQISALANAKLRSTLDQSFADVQLSQAKLMLLDAQNNEQNAMASLNNVMGSEQDHAIHAGGRDICQPRAAAAGFGCAAAVSICCASRPCRSERKLHRRKALQLRGARISGCRLSPRWRRSAARRFAPTRFNPTGTAPPEQTSAFPSSMGSCSMHERRKQNCKANAAGEQVRNLRDQIARDVRVAMLNAQNAYQKIGVTQVDAESGKPRPRPRAGALQNWLERNCGTDAGATWPDGSADRVHNSTLFLRNVAG